MTTITQTRPVTAALVAGWVYTFHLATGTRVTGRYAYTAADAAVVVIDARDLVQKRLSTVHGAELVSVRSQASELADEPWE